MVMSYDLEAILRIRLPKIPSGKRLHIELENHHFHG